MITKAEIQSIEAWRREDPCIENGAAIGKLLDSLREALELLSEFVAPKEGHHEEECRPWLESRAGRAATMLRTAGYLEADSKEGGE